MHASASWRNGYRLRKRERAHFPQAGSEVAQAIKFLLWGGKKAQGRCV